ncbi:large proline-rich protein BAG6-like [Aquila chrysaetos chrysaetos]|uniref:large proline-rich protein BAG6-like n=1 Tax=Aquila chrysaetos chrysaetos TaxID=223781 RepID=UPI00117683C7|nr:large proline-rich protein BAG6-like [Aquila chrysaetos chrysaetos]
MPFVVAEDDRAELSMRVLWAARLGLLQLLGPAPPPPPPPPPQPHPRAPEALPGGQRAARASQGGGGMDSALYHFTTLVCSVGTCYSLWSLAQASRPKKN